jgi:GNAT superfamily N-acetyltransferase
MVGARNVRNGPGVRPLTRKFPQTVHGLAELAVAKLADLARNSRARIRLARDRHRPAGLPEGDDDGRGRRQCGDHGYDALQLPVDTQGLRSNASRRHNGRDSGNARQNGGMSAAEITLLSGDGAAEAEALGRLLAQVSSHPVPLTADRVREVLRTPSTSVLVARLGGEIVGMALLLTLTTLSGDTGYVEEVVVDQTARGQHISTALMRALLDLAARKGLRFVDLTSRPSRVVANRLYQSLGFRLRETNCYRHDLATR